MSTIDRQIMNALDKIHDPFKEPCRWQYDGLKDIYSCEHMTIKGYDVISRVEAMNHFVNAPPGEIK